MNDNIFVSSILAELQEMHPGEWYIRRRMDMFAYELLYITPRHSKWFRRTINEIYLRSAVGYIEARQIFFDAAKNIEEAAQKTVNAEQVMDRLLS